MKINRILLTFSFLSILNIGLGQGLNVIPSSPEASSLGKHIEFPVSSFTGTTNIVLPLFTGKYGGYQIPVELRYHSSGVKVQEIPSRTGAGWSLHAGGFVICAINGTADLGSVTGGTPPWDNSHLLDDGGMDVFYYNFAGYSGKFVLKIDPFGAITEVVKLDSNNLKIWFPSEETIHILDEWGNLYTFQTNELSTTTINYMSNPMDETGQSLPQEYSMSYTTAWGLASIELNDGKRINLHYDEHINASSVKEISSIFVDGTLLPPGANYGLSYGYRTQQSVSADLLTDISYGETVISFSYNHTRQDYNGDKALTGIKVFSNRSVKSISLAYSYRTAFNVSAAPDTYSGKRLFLDSVQDVSDLSSAITSYKLKYNETALPHRGSYNMDMWGYFNQTGTPSILPVTYVYPRSVRHHERYLPFKRPSSEPVEIIIPGRNLDVNPSLVQAGLLTTLIYGTGGSTTFEYEPNEFLWFPETSTNISNAYNLKAGGVRIKRLTHDDGINPTIKTEFEYNFPFQPLKTSGAITQLPIYSYPGIAAFYKEPASETIAYYTKVLIRSFKDMAVLGSLFNSPIGYRYVTVRRNDKSKTVHQYSFPGAYGERHDDTAKGCRLDIQGFCDNLFNRATILSVVEKFPGASVLDPAIMGFDINSDSAGTYPFAPPSNYDWNRGLPIKELSYDSTGKMVKKVQFEYYTIKKNINLSNDAYASVCCGVRTISGSLTKSTWSPVLVNVVKKLKREREVIYAMSDSISTVKEIVYDSQKLLQSQESIATSKAQQRTTQFKYPHHFSGNAVFDEMVRRNILAPIVEEKTILGTTSVNTLTTDYAMNWFPGNKLIAPKNKWEATGSNPAVKLIEFKTYDSIGNPLSITTTNGSYSYKWTKSGNLLAEFTNATFEESYFEGFERDTNATIDMEGANTGWSYKTGDFTVPFIIPNSKIYFIEYWYKEQGKWLYLKKQYTNNMVLTEGDAIDDVCITPQRTLKRTFAPHNLFGLLGEIDKSGNKVIYEYNNFGRLSFVRDGDANIVKSLRYSYYQNPDIISPLIHSNDEQSQAFTRNNCRGRYDGETMLYKVLKGKYRSSISKNDANNKALAEINANGQEYANRLGKCIERCDGPDRKWINGVCEHGDFRYTRSVQVDDYYDCYYRYYFSDGTYSAEFLAGSYPTPCSN